MTTVADIKKFVLRVMLAFAGQPVQETELVRVVNDGFTVKPLHSDVKDGLRELEIAGFIRGVEDDLDRTQMTWTLTAKGTHRAKELK